jgi:hypothetical protein
MSSLSGQHFVLETIMHLHSCTVTDSSARQISTSRLRLELNNGL